MGAWEENIIVNKIPLSFKQNEVVLITEVNRKTGMIVDEQIEGSPSHAASRRTFKTRKLQQTFI